MPRLVPLGQRKMMVRWICSVTLKNRVSVGVVQSFDCRYGIRSHEACVG